MKSSKLITFGPFSLDQMNECLWRGSQILPLRPKAFAVLTYLLAHPSQLVTKQQILDAVWPDTFVTDAVLKDSIRQLREVLGDDPKSPKYIETAHRRGYRFVAPMTHEEAGSGVASEPQAASNGSQSAGSTFRASPNISVPNDVVGREASLSLMRRLLEKALRGERQIVFLTGEAGIGKTTLTEIFVRDVASDPNTRVGVGQCLEQYGEGEAYLPVLEAISRLCRGTGGARVVEVMSKLAPTWLSQIPSVISAADQATLKSQMLGGTRERMLREMAEAVEALATENLLVMVLEDLHWSDYSTLDLITYLARRREAARLMVVGTYRPVEIILSDHPLKGIKQELQIHRLCVELPLDYLTEEGVAQYLSMRLPRHQLPDTLPRLIHKRTEGNPLFMVNAVDYLLDEKIITEKEGRWRVNVESPEVELGVPENIQHLIEKQIERLNPEEQRILEGASVAGMECSAVAIAAGLDEDIVHVEDCCDRLARRHQFLSSPSLVTLPNGTVTPRFKFIHMLYLDVIYKRIPPTRRAQIHSRIGKSGEEVYGEQAGEIAAELAVHFEQGRDWNRAVKYLCIAAENAARRFANHEAVNLARRGIELSRKLPETPDRASQDDKLRRILASRGLSESELGANHR